MTTDLDEAIDALRTVRRSRTPRGAGTKPAVVVVDFQRAFTENDNCGPDTVAALRATARLLAAARATGVPVVYLTVIYDRMDDIPLSWRPAEPGVGISKCLRGGELTAVHPLVTPELGDIVVEKWHASGFYGTTLHEHLQHLGIDTLLVAGTSTSGCVRATVVDGAARSYRMQVVEECVDDFRLISGEAALDDLAERYGDVVSLDTAISYLSALPVSASAP